VCSCTPHTDTVLSVPDYSFPFVVIILSVVSNAAHFAYKLEQVSNNKRKTGVKEIYMF
jgi:hypothetical protein